MKKLFIILVLVSLFFTGCSKNQALDDTEVIREFVFEELSERGPL